MRRSRRAARRRGVVLLMVLVVVVILALAAYSFCDLMLTHYEGAKYAGQQTQARLMIDSAVDATRIVLSQPRTSQLQAGGTYDNPQLFQAVIAAPDEDPALIGAYTVLAPMVDDQGYYSGVRYGLEDLSSRLNLNYLVMADSLQEGAGRSLLLTVPGMDEELADSILDFLDADDSPRELGAESNYYSGQGYQAKNGPLDTIEELLEVRDVTPYLLFGLDINRNGVIDPHEQDLGQTEPGLERGWAPFITLHSKEGNLNADGLARVYINQEDLQLLEDELQAAEIPQEWITFILAYRLEGAMGGDWDDEGKNVASADFDLTENARGTISRVLDLVGSQVEITLGDDDDETIINSPCPLELGALNYHLPVLMDKVTVNPAMEIPGRININQASRAVLLGIPGISEELVDVILDVRQGAQDGENANFDFETWLLTEGLLVTEEGQLDLDMMKNLMPYLCARGDVYSAQIVGFFMEGAVSARAEVIFDATSPTMTVLLWRDMSHLGRGYAVDVLGAGYGIAALGPGRGATPTPARR